MDTTMSEVVQFIQENDVKFIRLAFCDIFGNQKNIAIMPTELERAFEQGIHFNAAALRGFLNVEASDLLLFPDPATLSVLPWRGQPPCAPRRLLADHGHGKRVLPVRAG